MATRHPSGRLQMSPVTVAADSSGRAVVSTRETARKARNVVHDPWTSLCVFTDRFFGEWIQIEGEADVIHLPEAMEPLVDYYRAVSGEHPDWDDYRESMRRDQRVLLRITIRRAGPDTHG